MDRPLLPVLANDVGGRLFVVLWGGMAASSMAPAGPAGLRPALVLALIGTCSLGLGLVQLFAIAGVGWMVLDGFVAHSYGDLAFADTDLALLAVVLLVAVTAAAVSGNVARR